MLTKSSIVAFASKKLNFLTSFYQILGYQLVYYLSITLFLVIFETLSILSLIPVFTILSGVDEVAPQVSEATNWRDYLKSINIWFITKYDLQQLIIMTISLFSIKAVFHVLIEAHLGKIRGTFICQLKQELITSYFLQPWRVLHKTDAGNFTTLLTENVTRSVVALNNLGLVMTQIYRCFIYIFFSFTLAPNLGLVSIISGVGLFILFQFLNKLVMKNSRKLSISNLQLAKYISSTQRQVETILVKREQTKVITQSASLTGVFRKIETRRSIFQGVTVATREPYALLVVAIGIGLEVKYLDNEFSIVGIASIFLYRALGALNGMQQKWQAALDYSGSFLEICEKLKVFRAEGEVFKEKVPIPFKKEIEIKNVTISSPENESSNRNLLANVSMSIKPGEFVAILGPSGSGKTTLIRCMLGLVKPSDGTICIDGKSIYDENIEYYPNAVGFIPQKGELVTGTIRSNLHNSNELSKRLTDLLDRLQLKSVIDKLPKQFDTSVNELGSGLSGGQVQRILLAKELLNKPSLLILDEPTSALDDSLQHEVFQLLNDYKSSLAIIVVTHNSQILSYVDKAFVIDGSSVREKV